jgi:hypothetical protein
MNDTFSSNACTMRRFSWLSGFYPLFLRL